jgi:hypothetical protein
VIHEGERSLKLSKQRALLKSLLAKAFKGDVRAASLVFQLVAKFVVLEEVASMREQDLLSDEQAAILCVLSRSASPTKNKRRQTSRQIRGTSKNRRFPPPCKSDSRFSCSERGRLAWAAWLLRFEPTL